MSPATAWAVETLIASTLLMALVLAIRGPVRQRFGAQVAYCLWALPLLRLMLPPIPAAWRDVAATPISRASETITIIMVDPVGATAAVPSAAAMLPSLGTALAALWAVGALALLGWHVARHKRFCRRMIAEGEVVDRVGSVRVITSNAAPGPLAFGVMRRFVAFPRDFAGRYDEDERALALAHEIGHHERGDLIANWAALGVLAIHWFNPIAWRAFRAFRNDQELANDARVLAGRSAIDRHHYACAILKAAHGGAVSAACHLHTIDDLKGRLRMLTTSPTSRRRLATGGAVVSGLAMMSLALTASGTSAAAAITTRVAETISVDLQRPPVPPAPPTPVDAPPAAVAPVAPTAPVAPEAPAATGKKRHVVIRRVDKDGHVTTSTSDGLSDAEIDAMVDKAMANVPEVRERRCGEGTGGTREMVINRREGTKKIMVICTERIEKMAASAARASVDAAHTRRIAMQSARAGIESARASIMAERHLTEAQRQEALKGLDQAMVEMQAEQAKADD